MKKVIYLLITVLVFFSSCNAEILRNDIPEYNGATSTSGSTALFRGDAPKHIYASKSYYPDQIVVTFDSVVGADYYEIYRASLPRSVENYTEADIEWLKNDTFVASTGGSEVTFIDTPDEDERDSYFYLYVVRAGSYFNGGRGEIEGEFSSIAEGWTLSPPVSVNATQGVYIDSIFLQWEVIHNVSGYNVYKRNNTTGEWEKVNRSLVPNSQAMPEIAWNYSPSALELGKDLYFKVTAVSVGNRESNLSALRNGYTYVEGAPLAPTHLTASQADYIDRIVVSWDDPHDGATPNEENKSYTWEIYRSTSTTDQVLIHSFNEMDLGTAITKDSDGKFVYVDSSENRPQNVEDLSQNVEYIYTVRGIGKIEDTENQGSYIDALGPSSSTTGCIMSVPTDIRVNVNYPSGGSLGSFDFIFPSTPIGYSADKIWYYDLHGRANNGSSVSDWSVVYSAEVAEGLTMSVDFATYPYNEFVITLRNLTSSTNIDDSTIIVTDAVNTDGVTLNSNRYNSALFANENGVYPVWLSIVDSTAYKSIDVRVTRNGVTEERTLSIEDLRSSNFALTGNLSPSNPLEIYSYSFRASSYFGRVTPWTRAVDAYGAVTGEKFIKLFEAYCLKPWEFVNSSLYLTDSQKAKWNNSEIKQRIDKGNSGSLSEQMQALTGGSWIYQATDYYGGQVGYAAAMQGIGGSINFSYNNASEHENIWANGGYNMSVDSGGNGTATGTVTVSGMYPATINFGTLSVVGKAFQNDYTLVQDNGQGSVRVTATSNN